MYDSKTILLVKELSRVELTRFRDFIRSPYFNKHQKVIELFEIIYEAHPNLSSPKLKKENVFKKLYPGKKFIHPSRACDELFAGSDGRLHRHEAFEKMLAKNYLVVADEKDIREIV
jgi:hypothetical protein